MKLAIDSSALTKRYVLEVGSDQLNAYLQQASQLGVSIILVPEIISAMNRRLREAALSAADYRIVKRQMLNDIRDCTVLQITPAVVAHSLHLLEENTLRAMDALHVACALAWRADLFITADRRQLAAAENAGMQAAFVGA